jgi:hypothetical protein
MGRKKDHHDAPAETEEKLLKVRDMRKMHVRSEEQEELEKEGRRRRRRRRRDGIMGP